MSQEQRCVPGESDATMSNSYDIWPEKPKTPFALVSMTAPDKARHFAMQIPRCPAAGFRSALPMVCVKRHAAQLTAFLACAPDINPR
jgi:hypothetical protein